MEQWKKIGKFIATHMAFIVPFAVAAGVLFPDFFGEIENFITPMFAFMTFQGSLGNTFKSVLDTYRHPLNMVIILSVTMIGMPIVACGLANLLFAGNADLITGATLEYCVPVAVIAFMWVDVFDGDRSLTLATILISTLICPFTIPFSLQLLLGTTVEVDAIGMMTKMIYMVMLPAIAGIMVNEFTHGWGKSALSPAIAPAARILNVIIVAANSSQMSYEVLHMNAELFAMAAFIFVYCAFGYALGFALGKLRGLKDQQLIASCFCTGLRNISAGCVIAAQFFGGSVVFPVMMGTLFQQILAGVSGSAMTKYLEKQNQNA